MKKKILIILQGKVEDQITSFILETKWSPHTLDYTGKEKLIVYQPVSLFERETQGGAGAGREGRKRASEREREKQKKIAYLNFSSRWDRKHKTLFILHIEKKSLPPPP